MLDSLDIPAFPTTTPLERRHRALLHERFSRMQPQISEFSFAYLWSWSPQIKPALSRLDDVLLIIIHNTRLGETIALPPVTGDPEKAAAIIPRILDADLVAAVARAPRGCAERVSEKEARLTVGEDRERADYVYPARQLIDLPGRRFHSKRNHIRRFWNSRPGAEYRAIDGDLAAECVGFSRRWLDAHPEKHRPDLRMEVEACVRMLEGFKWLDLRGGAILEGGGGGRIVAFSVGEELNRDTFVIRLEKAASNVPGAYQVINREFVRHSAAGYEWVNREQDLGIAGLRRAKQSYGPHHLVEKYRISLQVYL